jgi:hypothetical protein
MSGPAEPDPPDSDGTFAERLVEFRRQLAELDDPEPPGKLDAAELNISPHDIEYLRVVDIDV